MKKIVLSFVFLLFFAPAALAQDFNYEKAYGDYTYNLEQYKKAHSEYLLARGQYMQAKTLASETRAVQATKNMLVLRDEVMATYMTALRMKVSESVGLTDADRGALYTRIDSEVTYFRDHKGVEESAGTLSDLADDSKAASEHFNAVTVSLSYEVLSNLSIGEVGNSREETSGVLSQIKTKVGAMREKSDVAVVERWVGETESKIARSLEKQVSAQTLLFSLQSSKNNKQNRAQVYNQVIANTDEGFQLLKEAGSFMRETVNQMKILLANKEGT